MTPETEAMTESLSVSVWRGGAVGAFRYGCYKRGMSLDPAIAARTQRTLRLQDGVLNPD